MSFLFKRWCFTQISVSLHLFLSIWVQTLNTIRPKTLPIKNNWRDPDFDLWYVTICRTLWTFSLSCRSTHCDNSNNSNNNNNNVFSFSWPRFVLSPYNGTKKKIICRWKKREREKEKSSICQTNNQYPKFNSFSISLNPSEIQHFS
jgi:hypothetical protein